MPKITKKFQRIFCGDVPANNVVAQFGSLKAASPTYSSDPAIIQNLAAWGSGWSGAVINNSAPALQDMNSLFYVLTRQIAYLMQTGVAEYDASTIYYIGSLAYDGVGRIYKCLVDDTTGVNFAWTEISTVTTLNYQDRQVRCAGTSYAVTIPEASLDNKGRKLTIKNAGTGVITIDATGGSLIDGLASQSLSQYGALELISNGTSWDIV
jgi:hypothetical protein